jgi:tetraacyldisaccharide 4'-kinase
MLIASKSKVPVVICKKRPKAVENLLEQFPDINIIISDDGLQHTALHRDIEIVLFKEDQSPLLFPAGSLREPLSRLKTVDFIVTDSQVSRTLSACVYLLNQPNTLRALCSFKGQKVYAVAGTAYPSRFFEALKMQGIEVIECPCPDHYKYKWVDFKRLLEYTKKAPVFITEKDAVKLKEWKEGENPNIWVVPMVTKIAPSLIEGIANKVSELWTKNY